LIILISWFGDHEHFYDLLRRRTRRRRRRRKKKKCGNRDY